MDRWGDLKKTMKEPPSPGPIPGYLDTLKMLRRLAFEKTMKGSEGQEAEIRCLSKKTMGAGKLQSAMMEKTMGPDSRDQHPA